jgi:hypothetical protein
MILPLSRHLVLQPCTECREGVRKERFKQQEITSRQVTQGRGNSWQEQGGQELTRAGRANISKEKR